MDPIAALGVAAAVVQFVDVGVRVVRTAYSTYQSTSGALEDEGNIQRDVEHLRKLCVRLNTPYSGSSQDEIAIRDLAAHCGALSAELVGLLEKFKVDAKSEGLSRMMKSLHVGARRICKENDADKKLEQLDRIKLQINNHLINILLGNVKVLANRNEDLHIELSTQIKEETDRTVALLQQQHLEQKRCDETITKQVQSTAEDILKGVSSLIQQCRNLNKTQHILQSLWFEDLPKRKYDVKTAYKDTFEWIFEGDHANLSKWLRLESPGNMFWITGKPGSGKSTLMKYICDHTATETALTRWADGKKLVTASYFFWSTGTPEQKSQQGLLRSLLYQILHQCPHIIPDVVPERWAACEEGLFHKPRLWELEELTKALHTSIAQEARLSAKFCFFIDGLDEFKGRHVQLVRDLQRLHKSRSVKICVSSRPWTEFKRVYEVQKDFVVTMEALTANDMKIFVNGMLEPEESFQELDPDVAKRIVTDILDRAAGVFLWVFLVVRSLIRGLDQGDNVHRLEERIGNLPSDLEKYFEHMLESIDEHYKSETAQALRLITRESPLPLTVFSHLPEVAKDPGYALRIDQSTLGQKDRTETLRDAYQWVNAGCRDLLEVKDEEHSEKRVDFLHRTVGDFLRKSQVAQKLLAATAGPESDVDLTLVRCHLVKLKMLLGWGVSDYYLREATGDVLFFAGQCRPEMQSLTFDMIDQVGQLLTRHSTQVWHHDYGDHKPYSFLDVASSFGLYSYLRNIPPEELKDGRISLNHVLDDRLSHARLKDDRGPNIPLLELLLERGVNLHGIEEFDRHPTVLETPTPWYCFLARCHDRAEDSLYSTRLHLWSLALVMLRCGRKIPDPDQIFRIYKTEMEHHGGPHFSFVPIEKHVTTWDCLRPLCSDRELLQREIEAATANSTSQETVASVSEISQDYANS